MKTRRCAICDELLPKGTESFPFCSPRCKLVDAGNWFEGAYRIDMEPRERAWGEN